MFEIEFVPSCSFLQTCYSFPKSLNHCHLFEKKFKIITIPNDGKLTERDVLASRASLDQTFHSQAVTSGSTMLP